MIICRDNGGRYIVHPDDYDYEKLFPLGAMR